MHLNRKTAVFGATMATAALTFSALPAAADSHVGGIPATVPALDRGRDLALLRVADTTLVPVRWADRLAPMGTPVATKSSPCSCASSATLFAVSIESLPPM